MARTLPPTSPDAAPGADPNPERDTLMNAVLFSVRRALGAPEPIPPGETITTLAAEWRDAYAKAEAVEARYTEAEAAASALFPPAPPPVSPRKATWGQQEARENWEDQTAAISAAHGLDQIDAELNAAFKAANVFAQKILRLRPATPTEAALKYGIVLERHQDGHGGIDEPGPFFAFLDDLEHLAALAA